jgi:hypothetical protein
MLFFLGWVSLTTSQRTKYLKAFRAFYSPRASKSRFLKDQFTVFKSWITWERSLRFKCRSTPEKDARKRDLASRRAAESHTLLSNYTLNSGEVLLHEALTPVEFTFDESTRTLSIVRAEASSFLYDYPRKVSTTSEMLRYLAAITTFLCSSRRPRVGRW